EPVLLFDIMVHLATLGSLAAVFRAELAWLWRSLRPPPPGASSDLNPTTRAEGRRFVVLILVGTLPTGLMGLLFYRPVEQLTIHPAVAGAMLVVTGGVLWATRRVPPGRRQIRAMGWTDALLIGAAQGSALVPGLSRTGVTIAMALFLGLDRELAARYGLLLGIPAIVGAVMVGLVKGGMATTGLGAVLTAMVVAFAMGYVALRVVLRTVVAGRLAAFAPYCWAVGLVILITVAVA
ncbi:MAG: undecaprenyl-diphosphate phosphatase, partial [Nitrospinota bacterium]